MMQLARTASLIVVLSLFAAPLTASAECAWILWGPRSNASGVVFDQSIVQAFDSRVACEAVCAQIPVQAPPGDPTLVQALFTCLPDTVDPRAPKGSAR